VVRPLQIRRQCQLLTISCDQVSSSYGGRWEHKIEPSSSVGIRSVQHGSLRFCVDSSSHSQSVCTVTPKPSKYDTYLSRLSFHAHSRHTSTGSAAECLLYPTCILVFSLAASSLAQTPLHHRTYDNHVAPPKGHPLSRRLVLRLDLHSEQIKPSFAHDSGLREPQQARSRRKTVHHPRPRQQDRSRILDPAPRATQGDVYEVLMGRHPPPEQNPHHPQRRRLANSRQNSNATRSSAEKAT
jgi:hypothetical protein